MTDPTDKIVEEFREKFGSEILKSASALEIGVFDYFDITEPVEDLLRTALKQAREEGHSIGHKEGYEQGFRAKEAFREGFEKGKGTAIDYVETQAPIHRRNDVEGWFDILDSARSLPISE